MSQGGSGLEWEDAPRRRGHDGRRPGVTRNTVLLTATGLVLILGLLLTQPRERGEVMAIPRELSGRWGTTDPRYSDRRLIIERERVDLVLDQGSEGIARYPIDEVRGWEEEGRRGYRIHYRGDEGEMVMEVYAAGDGTLRLKNPSDVVWRRVR